MLRVSHLGPLTKAEKEIIDGLIHDLSAQFMTTNDLRLVVGGRGAAASLGLISGS